MTSDDATAPRDVRFGAMGSGMSTLFKCGRCHKRKAPAGRRMQRVLGLRTYVCAGCYQPPRPLVGKA